MMLSSAAWADLITSDQAKAAVRSFESDPSLQFSDVSLEEDTDPDLPTWYPRQKYSLTQDDLSGVVRDWEVDAVSGEVTWAYYRDAYPTDDLRGEEPFGPLTQEECRQIADTFARAHYSGFSGLNMQLDSSGEWTDKGWSFIWHEILTNGATTPNRVAVEVNPGNGLIEYYSSQRIVMPSLPEPVLTAEQALAAAASAVGIVTILWNDEPSLFADPNGIYWGVDVAGLDSTGKGLHRLVEVDAVSGDIVDVQNVSAGEHDPDRVSVPRATKGMVWIRDVAKRLGGYVEWRGKSGALFVISGHKCVLKPSRSDMVVDGKTVKLTGKMRLAQGKLMVPSDLINYMARLTQKGRLLQKAGVKSASKK